VKLDCGGAANIAIQMPVYTLAAASRE
jgi:hypothetical protein